MFDIDRWKEIISALKKNRLRSFLTAFGVFWGIFMLIIMAGVGKGLENGMFEGVGQVAQNSFFMWTNNTSEPYQGFRRGRWWNFDNEDVNFIKKHIPEADIVSPRIFAGGGGGNNTIRADRAASFYIKGDYPEWNDIDPANVLKGRWLNNVDIIQRRKICVVGEQVIKELFDADENPIGEYLKVNGVYYKIVGVIKPVSNINMNGRSEESIFIPFSTMQVAYNYGNNVHVLGVTTKPGYSAAFVEKKVMDAIKQRHKIAPTDVQAIAHVNLEKQFKQFGAMFDGIRILTWIVGFGTLLAGVIGVSNIMLVIVRERTQEIGIMRAIGATPRKIIGQIMLESVFITAVAGYIGIFVGILVLEGLNYILKMVASSGGNDIFIKNPEINLTVAVSCLIVLIVSGAIAGYIPAHKAVKIKTIDALRAK
ncbi:MAG TPA: ABC transporter permease [Prolixibacteraceae bacterium]|nr:ABC transporter permease [Prolixibacteraceae bacterium]